mmetsp:Transcript_20214/g.19866  ORF Transcript_20214/g.19866 Transcript_20214/m.19866 type:complete len:95 (+) Transcript_20214:33-317(+)
MKANDMPQKMNLDNKDRDKMGKTKAFKDLKIMNPNIDSAKPMDPSKFVDLDNKLWENGFTPNNKMPINFYGECNSVQKFGNQIAFNNDSMKSPD